MVDHRCSPDLRHLLPHGIESPSTRIGGFAQTVNDAMSGVVKRGKRGKRGKAIA